MLAALKPEPSGSAKAANNNANPPASSRSERGFNDQLSLVTRDRGGAPDRDRPERAERRERPEPAERPAPRERAARETRSDRATSNDQPSDNRDAERSSEADDRTDTADNQARDKDTANGGDDSGDGREDTAAATQSEEEVQQDGQVAADNHEDTQTKTVGEFIDPLAATLTGDGTEQSTAALQTAAAKEASGLRVTTASSSATGPVAAAAAAGRPGQALGLNGAEPATPEQVTSEEGATAETEAVEGDEFESAFDGDTLEEAVRGERAAERALAVRRAWGLSQAPGANAAQAASGRGADIAQLDPAALPTGTSQTGSSSGTATVIRIAPAAAGGQAAAPVHTLAFHIAKNVDNGVNRFEIRLDPPELGKLDVTMEMDNKGRVRVHMVVERAEALDFLQRDARALEKALSDAGLDVDRESVSFSLDKFDQHAGGSDLEEFGTDDGPFAADDGQDDVNLAEAGRHYISATGVDIRI